MTREEAIAAYQEARLRAKLVYDQARLVAQAKRNAAYAALGADFPGHIPPGKSQECGSIEQAYDMAMGKADTAYVAYTRPYHEALLAVSRGEQPEQIREPEQPTLWEMPA